MLSLDQCRLLLGREVEVTPQELERLREQLYALAALVLDDSARRKAEQRTEECPEP